jgi:Flp pilus assembly protein TadD
MSNELEQWQWVDEDPFEKMLGERSLAKSTSDVFEPAREEILSSIFTTAVAESGHPAENFDPPVRSQNNEQSAQPPADRSAADWRAADSYFACVMAESNDLTVHHFDRAVSLQKLGQWEAAANSFRQALQVDPRSVNALIGLGACLLDLDSLEEALDCFERCVFSDAERERALLGKAVTLHKLTRYEQANQAYRELLQLTPDSTEVLANLIALNVARRDTAAVADYSRRLLEVERDSKTALQGLATLAIWNGDQAEAVDYCTRLVEVDPSSFEAWHNLGFAMKKMRPVEQAMRSIA